MMIKRMMEQIKREMIRRKIKANVKKVNLNFLLTILLGRFINKYKISVYYYCCY